MLRLIIKEIQSARWILALGCLGVTVFTLFGNPFTFRGGYQDGSFAYLMIIFFALGLRAYSGEMKDDTVGFLYSRPIRWWQILIAKLALGVIGITLVLAAASLTYIIAAPDQYRPFIADGLGRGIPLGLAMCGCFYAIGFVFSALMPGMALAFASSLVVLVVLDLPFITAGMISRASQSSTWLKFASTGGANMFIFMILGAFVSTILVAQRLPKLGTKERLLLWAKLPALGSVLACLLAAIHFNIYTECLPDTKARALSPNGQWALYSTFPDAVYRKGKIVLVDTHTGRRLWSTSGKGIKTCAWAEDSSKFAYVTDGSKAKIVSMGIKPSTVWTAKINTFSKVDVSSGWMNTHISWKPDGDRLAVFFVNHAQDHTAVETKYLLNVLDMDKKTVYVSDHPAMLTNAEILSAAGDQPVLLKSSEKLFWPPGFSEL